VEYDDFSGFIPTNKQTKQTKQTKVADNQTTLLCVFRKSNNITVCF